MFSSISTGLLPIAEFLPFLAVRPLQVIPTLLPSGKPTERVVPDPWSQIPGTGTLGKAFSEGVSGGPGSHDAQGPTAREAAVSAAVDNVERDASTIADAFDDRRSLDWYRLVVAIVPMNVVWDAFARARDVARSNVRRSRAALFASLVGEHVDRKRGRRRPPAALARITRV